MIFGFETTFTVIWTVNSKFHFFNVSSVQKVIGGVKDLQKTLIQC